MTEEQRQAALEELQKQFVSAVLKFERAIGIRISKASVDREGDELNFRVIVGLAPQLEHATGRYRL
jgi:hypothetical protein